MHPALRCAAVCVACLSGRNVFCVLFWGKRFFLRPWHKARAAGVRGGIGGDELETDNAPGVADYRNEQALQKQIIALQQSIVAMMGEELISQAIEIKGIFIST